MMQEYKAKVGASWITQGSGIDDEITFFMPYDATPEQVEEEANKLAWEWASEYLDSWAHQITKIESNATERTDNC